MLHIPRSVQAALFDLNGTLLRDGAIRKQAYVEIVAQYGISLDDQAYQAKVANRATNSVWPLVFDRALRADEIERLSADREQVYFQLLQADAQPTPGSLALLTALRTRGTKTALVTSASAKMADHDLRLLGLEGCFDAVVDVSQASRGKPDPELYLVALQRLGIDAEDAIAFEDSPQGMESAAAAGIACVGVLPEYSAEQLRAAGAIDTIDDFTEVFA